MKPTVMRSDGGAVRSAPKTLEGTIIGAATAAAAPLRNCRRVGLELAQEMNFIRRQLSRRTTAGAIPFGPAARLIEVKTSCGPRVHWRRSRMTVLCLDCNYPLH